MSRRVCRATPRTSYCSTWSTRCAGEARTPPERVWWRGSRRFRRPIGFEVRDPVIAAGAEVAFCHGLKRVRATTTVGQRLDMWWRATICLRKVDGAWPVMHERASVPFDAASGRASLDLAP